MESKIPARQPLELYIHIPFCVRKCLYCDFLSFPAGEETQERYVAQLINEITAMGARYASDYQVVSIFLGGGTPSILHAEQTSRILQAVKTSFKWAADAEVTTEANPGTVDLEKLQVYLASGINRLSLGLQSTEDRELKALGRIHTFDEFKKSYAMAREAGFTNINVDLMSALPGQTEASYRGTLETVLALNPEHISAYSLIIEEGTPFYDRCEELDLPDEDEERTMYHDTKTILRERGYERYEISNYARPGYECRHNIGYWTGVSYLGLGLGASSYIGGERFMSEPDLSAYLLTEPSAFSGRRHHRDRHLQTQKEQIEEFMFLGLRLTDGVSDAEFQRRFGISLKSAYGPVITRLIKNGLLEQAPSADRLRLTEYGIDVSNTVLCEFLLD